MKLVIFGLTVSSSWGNGHATIWRGLCRALARQGHQVQFFERDVPYYAIHRDLKDPDHFDLVLYEKWEDVLPKARTAVQESDCAIVTSYCPDARPASDLVLEACSGMRLFYDLDTPVTLDRLRAGNDVDYIPTYGLAPFDLVLSYTGGAALGELQTRLGARRVAALYGCADPAIHRPVPQSPRYACDLSYLGTYAQDRQATLENLFVEPARRCPNKKFVIGGAQYPVEFPWTSNIWFVRHLPPAEHPSFYSSSNLTLSVTRAAMAEMGFCPSGRLFEAAGCGTPVISDQWEGLDSFFEPGREILIASTPDDVEQALAMPAEELKQVGAAARERALQEHTADHRSLELLSLFEVTA
jgi:spore maturation protein CgeB